MEKELRIKIESAVPCHINGVVIYSDLDIGHLLPVTKSYFQEQDIRLHFPVTWRQNHRSNLAFLGHKSGKSWFLS